MTLTPNSQAIIRLAWSRILGLPDDGLNGSGRVVVGQADADALMVVRIFDLVVISGPAELVNAANGVDDEELVDPAVLLRLAGADRRARILGAATLAYADELVEHPDLDSADIADDAELLAAVERACPPDDVGEAGIAQAAERFVLVRDDVAVAAAGYSVWEGILAHLGVLTSLAQRGAGLGGLIAAAATNDAIDAGLIPQWRARLDNHRSRGLALRLGYQQVGSQSTVLLG